VVFRLLCLLFLLHLLLSLLRLLFLLLSLLYKLRITSVDMEQNLIDCGLKTDPPEQLAMLFISPGNKTWVYKILIVAI
jgi:hypothetical protein